MVPNKVFFTKGVGVHKERLASFELALRAAGVTHRNLVLVSSIFPRCWQQRWAVDDCVCGSNPKYMLSSYCIHKKHLLTNGPSTNFSCFRTPTSPRGWLFSLPPIQIQAGGQLD